MKASHWVDGLRQALLPAACIACGAGTGGAPVCSACNRDLPWNNPACPACALPTATGEVCPACLQKPRAFDAATAAFRYETPVAEALLGLKYQARFLHAAWLAEALATRLIAQQRPLPQLIVPVPLHRGRLGWRGYNQSVELARHLGRRLALPVAVGVARRPQAAIDQIGQTAAARRRNLKDAFRVGPGVAGLTIALLDDVMTTGATLEELARAAKRAGAIRVEAWAIARQPLRSL